MSTTPVRLLVIGAGNRGTLYARWAQQHPQRARVVGVADPIESRRRTLAAELAIPPENVFADWRQAAARERFADAAIIATLDDQHREPALALAAQNYHLLLEKPLAPTEAECAEIVAEVKRRRILFAVGHVLLYTPFTREVRRLCRDGAIGEVTGLDRLEPVGWWHFAHSYVRGSWRKETASSSFLLAKACHDLDWIRHVVDSPCESVASFGSLQHFRRDRKPDDAGTAVRCVECAFEPRCPYSAPRLYLGMLERGWNGWPVSVVCEDPNEEDIRRNLAEGPYGRCVYECDNDVVDNQVVSLRFTRGQTASFTATAFTEFPIGRKTRIFGTRGCLEGDGRRLRLTDFVSGKREEIDTRSDDPGKHGHGGGDEALMEAFVSAVATESTTPLLSGPDETLESHRMVFAAERARRESRVIDL